MAGWSDRGIHVPAGSRFPITDDTIGGKIMRTRAPARIDSWDNATSELGALVRVRGIRSSLGAPVVVEGQLWGALVAGTDHDEPLPPETEVRLARFAELTATAVSNASTRAELIASRARIVTAGDEARRRIERNLHDGTQQRLIALGLDLQAVQATIPSELESAHEGFDRMAQEIKSVLDDVRELSRGLHPAQLARGGLGPSLRALARRSPIPVEVAVDVDERPPPPVETAVYYVVSEALTNAIRYSGASAISVTVGRDGEWLRVTIADNGSGGAEAGAGPGSGLLGLSDRVEALGGRFSLLSPSGSGTRISVELPVTAPVAP
jgi:signal transduction histidine kinase